MIAIACPACGGQLRLKDEYAGKAGRCPRCGEKIRIPNAGIGPRAARPSPQKNAEKAALESAVSQIKNGGRPGSRLIFGALAGVVLVASTVAAMAIFRHPQKSVEAPAVIARTAQEPRKAPPSPPPAPPPTDHALNGAQALERKNYDKAIAELSLAIEADPEHQTNAIRLRADAYEAKGQMAQAITDLNEVLRRSPDDAGLYYRRCCLNWLLDKPARALPDVNEAIRLDPKNGGAYLIRACLASELRTWATVEADIKNARRLDPDCAQRLTGPAKGKMTAAMETAKAHYREVAEAERQRAAEQKRLQDYRTRFALLTREEQDMATRIKSELDNETFRLDDKESTFLAGNLWIYDADKLPEKLGRLADRSGFKKLSDNADIQPEKLHAAKMEFALLGWREQARAIAIAETMKAKGPDGLHDDWKLFVREHAVLFGLQ